MLCALSVGIFAAHRSRAAEDAKALSEATAGRAFVVLRAGRAGGGYSLRASLKPAVE